MGKYFVEWLRVKRAYIERNVLKSRISILVYTLHENCLNSQRQSEFSSNMS